MPETVINLDIESLPEGGYVATSHDLPGLVAQGRTIAECAEIAQDVARKLVESYVEHGDPLPSKLRAVNPAKIELDIPISIP
ncbi:MAG TPA: type II toxin-antitoxin system HicB family antitoxin [Terriglobia bacterium]|jgi:predicted RNase H-like HicB family nuclease